jgi:putative pyruvate formate lyase activating enzyme
MGRTVKEQEFIRLCLALQELGAENINIVTGSHAAPVLASGIGAARKQGLRIPVLWNSSAYEGLEALALLKEAVEVWLPDLKTLDSGISASLFKAPDYPEQATAAILRMMEYRGRLRFGKPQGSLGGGYTGPVLVSGVIIRHLVLPGFLESTREVLRWFAEHGRTRALLSLMTQYTPVNSAGEVPDRYVSQSEYDTVLGWLEEFEIEDGFFQELVPDSGWLPDFTRENPFSSDLSLPVWHWKKGMLINL